MRKSIKAFALMVPAFFIAGPLLAQAAQIYLDPATGKYPPGVTFGVDVRLDNQGQCVNAAEVDIAYPKNLLEAVEASGGDSIFSLWIKEPTVYPDYGLVSLVGGLPGGYCGRVSGDTALSNKLATIYFRFPTSTVASVSSSIPISATITIVSSTNAVLNDGLGTFANISLAGATYTEILKGQYAPESAWDNLIKNDTTAPEAFRVGVYRDPSLFDDQLFAVFSAVDKQTGIDHYEVAEVPASDLGLPENQWNWARSVSPYLIKDQNLSGAIEVRAIDKAGNERLEGYSTQRLPSTPDWRFAFLPYLATVGFLGAIVISLVLRLL